ncbi:pyruvate, phosphate dikinase [Fervidicoccus fontis]|nr:pyruvate, phosphate dikinase [Fervidicoccus fontis]
MSKKYVYDFEEGDPKNKALFGGKGAGLALMTQAGLPVPPGFTITTDACRDFFQQRKQEIDEIVKQLEKGVPPQVRDELIKKLWGIIDTLSLPAGLMDEVREHMKKLEMKRGRKFGDKNNPLLVSVRSGAPVSMPGMMDTVLNLGLNDETVKGLAQQTNNERFAYDSYRRFLQLYGKIVLGIDDKKFDETLNKIKQKYNAKNDIDLDTNALKELVEEYKKIIREEKGEFIQDYWYQLEMAIKAVFRSWMNPRAIFYRIANKITPEIAGCTAVTVQSMVFGNMGMDSGTGVVFSRNVATGENEIYGEFLPNAQGEDVVAGIRTPMHISDLKERFPSLYQDLYKNLKMLEKVNKDVQDVEFTVEKGKLFFLQTRDAKMTPLARVKTAVDMAKEGILTKEEAILKVKPEHVLQLLYPKVDETSAPKPIAKGLAASPGAVYGQVVFDPDDAVEWAKRGKEVILVRVETKPDDVHGFYAAKGILTSRGGMTSHAAVVARGIGKTAVVGAEEIQIDYEKKEFRVNGVVIKEGDIITIDGNTGNVYLGKVPTVQPKVGGELQELLTWADQVRVLKVKANADVPEDARIAREYGAEGIGLLRIERMFRRPERLEKLRKVILSETTEERTAAMEELSEMIKKDFKEMLSIMDGLPVTIRLIDPPLHEFLPKPEELLRQIYEAKMSGASEDKIKDLEKLYKKVEALVEANPMMGHRGVRVGITFPEVYRGLTRAILEAQAELIKEGKNPIVQIMIPQVAIADEIKFVKEKAILPTAEEIQKKYEIKLNFKIGTMIETVRGAITADEIAKNVEFFSFGTNDLTQATFSFSRDDVENKFLPKYLELEILKNNPFEVIDEKGVGELVKIAVQKGRSVNPNIEIGVCGEHGGDPTSIEFFHKIGGIDYVSASPFRILVARLAAAHAAIKNKKSL